MTMNTSDTVTYSFEERGLRVRDLATGSTGQIRYRTTRTTGEFYMVDLDAPEGFMDSWMMSVPVEDAEVLSEPKSLVFAAVDCGRCSGRGHIPRYSYSDKGVCYSCSGRGRNLTDAGHTARKAYDAQRRAELATTYRELESGASFWYGGECMVKDAATDLRFQSVADVEVVRHDGAATRRIWIAIAASYSGATLKF